MNYNEFDLNLIKTFVIVAESKTISNASEKLYVSQPAVSSSIKKLESYLGGALFSRNNKGITLTKEGEDFYNYCKYTLKNLENAIYSFGEFKNLQKGQITIGCTSTIIRNVLIDCLAEFSKKYPNITLSIVDGISDHLLEELKKGKLDLAFFYSPMPVMESFNVIDITEIQDCFIAGKDYANIKDKVLLGEELEKLPIIVQKLPSNNRIYFDDILRQNNLSITPKMEMESFWLICDFVKKGAGIGFSIKDFLTKEFENGELFEVKTSLDIPARKIELFTYEQNSNSFAVKTFIDYVVEYFKK